MLEQKYKRFYVKNGVTVHIFYTGNDSDVCGTEAQFNNKSEEFHRYMPFNEILEGCDWYIYDMDSPVLDQMCEKKQANLEDFDFSKSDYQVAAELYFHIHNKPQDTDNNKSALEGGVFRPNWRPGKDLISSGPPTQEHIQGMFNALGHGQGHRYHNLVGYGSNNTEIRKTCNEWFDSKVKGQTQASNNYEYAAELYKRLFTDSQCFSDGKRTAIDPELACFMKYWYWLQGNLDNTKFRNFTVQSDIVYWEELEWGVTHYQTEWFFIRIPVYGWVSKGWYGVRGRWERVRWMKQVNSENYTWIGV